MLDLIKACTVCFSTEGKFTKIENGRLGSYFYLISGLKADDRRGLPQHLCVECLAYVRRFIKFRDKCKRAHYALKEILKRNKEVTKSALQAIKREQIGITPTLSYLNTKNAHYEQAKFRWIKHNRLSIVEENQIGIMHCSTITVDSEFEIPIMKPKLSDEVKMEVDESQTTLEIEYPVEPMANDEKDDDFHEQSTMNDTTESFFDNDANLNSDTEDSEPLCISEKREDANVDGSHLDEEYASMIPISSTEARAAVEVYKMFSTGKFRCDVCEKAFNNDNRYKIHLRMHNRHVSGPYFCSLCHFYYKSDFLLKTHMTEKHMYKYVCRKCPEVSFDRISAKQHYIWTHLQKGNKKHANWYDSRPEWLNSRGGKRVKGVVSLKPVRKIKKLPADFPVYSPVSQPEQYQLVLERKNTRNYLDAQYKCELCYRGFREVETYAKHMKKHDPVYSGKFQCDMCKHHFRDARKVYKHMIISHLFKFSCQMCSYVCYNRGQAHMHYRWHKNVTYSCPHCKQVFKKASTHLTHIRIKHPSTYICSLCGHSFVSENGLYCHKKLTHSKEEIEASELKTEVDTSDPHYCADCNIQFVSDAAFSTHLGSSNKHVTTNLSIKPVRRSTSGRVEGGGRGAGGGAGAGGGEGGAVGERRRRGRPRNGTSEILNNGIPTASHCEVCNEFLTNDVQARKHYEAEHPGAEYLKRYMCDVCGHTTRQYANLMVHMRTHTNEKPYGCPHCDRRFSMPSNRDRHLVVHTGEKRYQCQHCNRRFTQSSAVKLHIQTVHLKIPYAPWDKKNRKRRKELEGVTAAPAPGAVPACAPPKLLLDAQGDYLNAYITYNDE